MSRTTLRAVIVITTLTTAAVHLIALNIPSIRDTGSPDLMFTLNGLGYLGLLVLFLWNPGIVAERRQLFYYAFIGYTVVTILAWVVVGSRDLVGYGTKLDEVILVVALWQYMRAGPETMEERTH